MQAFFTLHGITSTIAAGKPKSKEGVDKSKGRAPSLLVTGKYNVANCITLLKTSQNPFVFTGVKHRDLLILEEIVNNTQLTVAQQIGLKKSLHKSNKDQPDLDLNGALPTVVWEARFGLPPGSVKKGSAVLLTKIDKLYTLHQETIRNAMKTGALNVSASYIAGLVDGDGCWYVTLCFRNPTKRYSKRMIEWQGNCSLSMEVNSKLTIEVFLYALGSTASITNVLSKTGNGQITSVYVLVRKQADVSKLLAIHDSFPLIGDYKSLELATVVKLFRFKKEGSLKNWENVCSFLEEIYYVSSISPKGRPRPLTLDEAKAKAAEWLK
jgi:hypothetical protein